MKIILTSFLLLVFTLPSLAASSDWDVVDGARIRLIGMSSPNSRTYRAGLQIELKPGWKTYWRNPGGSGLPPQLNFSVSTNVRSSDMKFPVPRYYGEDGSIGYKKTVTFPIAIEPSIAGLPMKVNVVGLVGICSDICIPTQIDLSMNTGASRGTDFAIAKALNDAAALVPTSPHQGFAIESVALMAGTQKAMVTARVPKQADEIELFVEGPPALYLTHGELVSRSESVVMFSINLVDAKDIKALVGTPFTFTLRADRNSIEQSVAVEDAQQ